MITSAQNAKVKRIASLLQKPRLRREEGVYIVEGIRMFEEAPDEQIEEIYVSESFLSKNDKKLSGLCKHSGVCYEVIADSVFGKMSDTQTPQGVICVMKMPVYSIELLMSGVEKTPLFMLLEDLQDPGNLGTILRTAEGAGVSGVIMTKGTVDIYNPKVIRATMGSIYRVPFIETDDLDAVIDTLKKSKVTLYAAHLDGSVDYAQCDYSKPTAFMIGNEARGLKAETAMKADCRVKIPMSGQVESLNAAVASAILMYESARQRRVIISHSYMSVQPPQAP